VPDPLYAEDRGVVAGSLAWCYANQVTISISGGRWFVETHRTFKVGDHELKVGVVGDGRSFSEAVAVTRNKLERAVLFVEKHQ